MKALSVAAAAAEKSCYKNRHGAVIYRGKQIISIGYNSLKTHPLASHLYEYPHIHAELDAVIKAKGKDLHGCSIAIVRINRSGYLRNSRPCSCCMHLLVEKGLKYITYSAKEKLAKEELNA